ncbi:MAG: hypothetical protein IJ863_03890, partial [Spirochaetales bacterium]|nr:hypothetical protein [Spirochaetales bacterium]
MKKGFIIIALATMLLALAGCSIYTNSYSAVGFIHSSTPKGGFMNFHTFKGRMVFNLRVKDSEAIVCSGKLEEGSLCVYYDTDGEKKELVKLDGGQTFG